MFQYFNGEPSWMISCVTDIINTSDPGLDRGIQGLWELDQTLSRVGRLPPLNIESLEHSDSMRLHISHTLETQDGGKCPASGC